MSKYGKDRTVIIKMEVPPRYAEIGLQMSRDLSTIVRKNAVYGDSWKRRGGAGAFLTAVRPWDRLENMAKEHGWDIFAAGEDVNPDNDSDILDSLRDVRNYLYLIEDEIVRRRTESRSVPQAGEEQGRLFSDEEEEEYDFERELSPDGD